MRFLSTVLALAGVCSLANAAYWLEGIKHQGNAPFAGSGYSVFRNVKDYGAAGDGTTDDTDAINKAISDGNRCGKGCTTTSTTPALVYFPAGTYLISAPILPAFITQMVGDATDPPTIKASSSFAGAALIDADPYYGENLNWLSTTQFYRQVRNFILDTTAYPASKAINCIHFPAAQATSLQNLLFNMPTTAGVQHVGIFQESGSGGLFVDLTFKGGLIGANVGNQQYTARSLVFDGCVTAINQLWDWAWTYSGVTIKNCQIGINMTGVTDTGAAAVGSALLLDSTVSNTDTMILTASGTPATSRSLVMENVAMTGVKVAVSSGGTTLLDGSTDAMTVQAYAVGHSYSGSATKFTADKGTTMAANTRPSSLVSQTGSYYATAKPQYETLAAGNFVSVIGTGAKGDGSTDDTAKLQEAIDTAVAAGSVVFLDHGIYKVTKTISIPAGTRMVGEAYPVIMSSGSFFADMANPKPVLQIGDKSGAAGRVELSDFVVGTQGAQAGAILIEYNLATENTDTAAPAGLWDVHTRIGGFKGSELTLSECPKITTAVTTPEDKCIGAFMSMHITKGASGLYMENCWLWTADHDLDDASNSQITIYAGRGLYIESTSGTFWMWGIGVEHHTLYQFQIYNSKDVFLAMPQTETPYYQPNPKAPAPFTVDATYNDPDFGASCSAGAATTTDCEMAWGLRVVGSSDVLVYSGGFYSFFSNWDATTCSTFDGGESCQARIVSLEGDGVSNVNLYNLATIGSVSMLTRDGTDIINYADNVNVFPSLVESYKSGAGAGGGNGTTGGNTDDKTTTTTTSWSTKHMTATVIRGASSTAATPTPATGGGSKVTCGKRRLRRRAAGLEMAEGYTE